MSNTSPRRKVLLYNPQAVFFTMPLALLAIGSELDPALYEVIIVDGRLDPDPEKTLRSHIDEAVCLGVTVLTGAPISDALRISRAAKRARADLPVVWGGWHPSMFASECLLEPSVDVTVRGQGEETFVEIVARLVRSQSLLGCAGCTVRLADGSIHENPPRPLAPVDRFRAQIPRKPVHRGHHLLADLKKERSTAVLCEILLRHEARCGEQHRQGTHVRQYTHNAM